MRALPQRLALVALAFASFGTAAAAQPAPVQGPANVEPRINQLIIYGGDVCPPSRLPEGDRYRIPPNLRDDPNSARNQSWANRAVELSYVGRTGTDSCSTVGGGGFTGCFNQMITAARAERTGNDQINWDQLIAQARQQRLSTIDQQARDAEGDEHPNSGVTPAPANSTAEPHR
jgi:hypothetical protein